MADRQLSSEEVDHVRKSLMAFTVSWAAHGKDLLAVGDILHDRFIILMVDEVKNGASGCSIDSSVAYIKSIEKELQVDFFNRFLLPFRSQDGRVETIRHHDLAKALEEGTLNHSTVVYNNLVQTKSDFINKWETTLEHSPYARLVH